MTTPLSELTTMRVGGTPAELLEAHSRDQLIEFATGVWATGEDWLVLGGGSNIVAADDLSELTVIRTLNRGIERDGTRLRVQAGENWDEFVAFTVDAGLTGVEALSGIPGCVGAAPVQNIGAYGQEVAETITRLEFVEYPSGEIRVLEASELGFGYRDSIFKRGCQGVITWVEFELREGSPASLDRLTQAIGREVSTSAEIRREVLATRAVKGMVLDDADRDTYSCGSFFTNPIVSEGFALGIPSEAPRWLQEDGTVKLSAAWLIENSGLRKGFSLGASKAALSTKHSLAITNRGGASAEEVAELARFIQHQVSNRWGINLVPEPNLIGF
jgi:UDP-N-acetylmuramate dehydrogenase